MSIYAKLLLIVGSLVGGFAVYLVVVNHMTHEKLEDSDYVGVVEMKDLVADVLPPPLYVIEARLIATELVSSMTEPNSRAGLKERWAQLQRDFADRKAYWTEHLDAPAVRSVLLQEAVPSAEKVFAIGNEKLIPAIDSGDAQATEAARLELDTAYLAHRRAIDDVVTLTNKQSATSVEIAAERIASRKLLLLMIGLVIIVLGTACALWIGRTIAQRTQALAALLERVAAGELRQRANDTSSDELGQMAGELNHALDSIEAVFVDVRTVATQLADTSNSLASSSDQISSGAQQQAASLEETAASLEEITATVKQSAGNAQQASQVATSSRDIAERGGSVVSGAISAMDEITKSSRRIGDIITTIDEIALQTNLLALNAAVEAARAGEQGRGFAVVAAEVGNLAQRSAAAAKEVKALIQDSLQRIDTGHQLVGESGRALSDIILSVKKVTDIVGEIAAASREQSIGVDQVNQAVSQMDQVTQSNAAQTEELSHTASDLSSNAEQLRGLLARFSLRDGSAAALRSDATSAASTAASRAAKRAKRPGAPELAVVRGPAQSAANRNDGSDFEVLSASSDHE